MRKLIWFISLAVILATLIGLAGGLVLAAFHPYHPGDGAGYTAQSGVEQIIVALDLRPNGQALRLLEIAARRNQDLRALAGSTQQGIALAELQQSLASAVHAVATAPQQEVGVLRPELVHVLLATELTLAQIKPGSGDEDDQLTAFRAWEVEIAGKAQRPDLLLAFLEKTGDPMHRPLAAMPTATITPTPTPAVVSPQMVYFPPGSQGAQHTFYPLTGAHLLADCRSCHTQGAYRGTANQCTNCHASQTPVDHYPGVCTLCHDTSAWKTVHFDHTLALAANCQTCHLRVKLANHYPGQCSTCHATNAWKPAHFDHTAAAAANCATCHTKDKPVNHWNAQCSACHSTTAWKPASFNHAAVDATDCQSCHTQNRPADHWNGQCSSCHNTKAWTQSTFNHAAVNATDCQSCHSKNQPTNHWAAQCSACHSTNAWKPASFNHAAVDATDCQSCHASVKPANHYNGQCSACHSTTAWKPATFNHAAAGATDCQSCHKPPANHYPGQCSQCHSTSKWSDASFNHPFPQNHGGANGQCATCHPSGYSSYTCFACHNQDEIQQRHSDVNGYSTDCIKCHPNGLVGGN